MIYKLIILVASIFMIYEFTKSRSTAVAEIEPQLIDIIENIPTPSIAVAEIEPQTVDIIEKEIILTPSISVAEIEPQIVKIIEKQFTEKPSTAVMDIKPKLTDYIHANKNFVESELHNNVLVVHQKENLLALETIFNKQDSFKKWVISIRQEEISAVEKMIMEIPIEDQLIYDNLVKQLLEQEKSLAGFNPTHPIRGSIETEIKNLKKLVAQKRSELENPLTIRQQIEEEERQKEGFWSGHYIVQEIDARLKKLVEKEGRKKRYTELLIELKANTSKIILFDANYVLDPLIIDFIQKHDISFLAWRNANENAWLKINGV